MILPHLMWPAQEYSARYELYLTRLVRCVQVFHMICTNGKGQIMGRYGRKYDAFGEPLTILPQTPPRYYSRSDYEVKQRIERELEDVCAMEDAIDDRGLPPNYRKQED